MNDAEFTICCPDEDRIEHLATRSGAPVFDVHRHKGLLRGFVHEGGKRFQRFWYRNGRLTRLAEQPSDLVRVA